MSSNFSWMPVETSRLPGGFLDAVHLFARRPARVTGWGNAHLHAAWMDCNRKLIQIPQHEACSCGYCKRQAREEVTHNDALSKADALASRWHPKTVTFARSLFFDLSWSPVFRFNHGNSILNHWGMSRKSWLR